MQKDNVIVVICSVLAGIMVYFGLDSLGVNEPIYFAAAVFFLGMTQVFFKDED